jgi:hypothetical protein
MGGAKKIVGAASADNDNLILTVTIHVDPADIKDMIGDDLGGHYTVAEVKVEPKYGKTVTIDRDDFLLRNHDNADYSKPYTGSQIAGNTTMVITKGEAPKVKNRPTFSIGGMGGGMPSSSGANDEYKDAKATVKTSDTDNPLVKALDAKILPEKTTDKPVTGLLYFPIEKAKVKNLELVYGGKDNRIALHFK